MNKRQTARLKRHRKVSEVLDGYPIDVQAVPAFAGIAQEFQDQLARVSGVPARRTAKGSTEQKGLLRSSLEAKLLKASNALYLLYRKEQNLEAARTLYRKPSEYDRLGDLALAKVGTEVSAIVSARAADLAAYNINAAAVQALAADAKAYDSSIDKPKTVVEKGKVTTATTAQLLRELNRYLKDEFYSGVELLIDSHPLLYALLQEAMRVDDAGSRKRKPGPDKPTGPTPA